MQPRELTNSEIDAVAGGTMSRGGFSITSIRATGGNGGDALGGIALLSGNAVSVGLLSGRTTSSGSAANATGGNGGAATVSV